MLHRNGSLFYGVVFFCISRTTARFLLCSGLSGSRYTLLSRFFSYALFGIAALFGGVALIRGVQEDEALQYKMVLVGYCFFPRQWYLAVSGRIWAWGTYWLWTPKELWTVILWLFYSFICMRGSDRGGWKALVSARELQDFSSSCSPISE